MPVHTVVPSLAVLLGVALVAASRAHRLPQGLWPVTTACGLGAVAVPTLDAHYAADRLDLLALASLTVCAYAAVAHASRSRVAQLPLTWRHQLDDEWRQLNSGC